MATTPNFNWATPDNTGLVKNGALDIRTLGNAIDASLVDLKGGTTGQVLAKQTNTDMDFTWTTPTDQTPLTTKGDLFTFTTVDARLGVGTNGQVLTADSTAATGLKWATAGSGAVVQVKSAIYSTSTSNATTTYADTGLTLSITPTSASNKILVFIQQYQKNDNTAAAWETAAYLRIMRDSTAIYNDGKFIWYASVQGNINYNQRQSTLIYLDSPATTSSVTYKTQQKMYATTITAQADSTPSTITLMEVTP